MWTTLLPTLFWSSTPQEVALERSNPSSCLGGGIVLAVYYLLAETELFLTVEN